MIEKWKAVEASPTQRFVGWILADAHNAQTGQCNPSVQRICQLTGYSDRAVAQAIQGLEDAGHLTVRRTSGGRSNYLLHPRTSFAPEGGSPPKEVRGTPEAGSGPPPNVVRPTPERRSGKTGIEPEEEPEPTGGSAPRHGQAVGNPGIPPITLEQAKANAGQYGASPEIAEKWWLDRDSVGWLDGRGQVIARPWSNLRSYAISWQANAAKDAARAKAGGGWPRPEAAVSTSARVPGYEF